jgi:hypothetical protein
MLRIFWSCDRGNNRKVGNKNYKMRIFIICTLHQVLGVLQDDGDVIC